MTKPTEPPVRPDFDSDLATAGDYAWCFSEGCGLPVGVWMSKLEVWLTLRGYTFHGSDQCSGEHCCVHNPSDHHMRDWDVRYRDDKGVVERVCPHGVGHPDPDDAAYWRRIGQGYKTIHGCDGCCQP